MAEQKETKSVRKTWIGKFIAGAFSPARIFGYLFLALFLTLRVLDTTVVQDIRNFGFDFLHQQKPREYVPQPVRIVDIDEKSLEEIGQWPWPRTVIAKMVDQLAAYGAVVTTFDIVFSEKDRLSPSSVANDNPLLPDELRQALRGLPDNEVSLQKSMQKHRVILGEASVRSQRDAKGKELGKDEAPPAMIGADPRQFLERYPYLVQNLDELNQFASGKGIFAINPGRDGVIRRVPIVLMVGDKIRLALSLEALRIATGGLSYATRANDQGMEGIVVAKQRIKTDANGRIWPYFSKQVEDRYVSASDVINGKVDPKFLRGHLVLVGTSASGLEDLRTIPLGNVPGVEVHAQIMENVLTKSMLTRPFEAIAYELFAIFLAGMLIIWLAPIFGAVLSTVLFVATLGSLAAISWYYFANQRILFDATWPMITAGVLFVVVETANYIREEQQKRQIRDAFGQYLSPALVGRLSENPEELVLGGETRELTVLFTDVRGFTGLSESYKTNPQGLTQLMNRFLTELSRPILERNGTIDKYMGDAIMAFWNAPLDFEQHIEQGCRAALDMITNVDALNEEREQELKGTDQVFLPINVGIGINTGTCVVGNMGSVDRFDYTALGDTVNIASRLEGQSKPYGLAIVIGPLTAEAVKDVLAVFEIDMIRVKGKNEPIRIFCLAGDEAMGQSEDFQTFRALNSAMLASYKAQEWEDALDQLDEMEQLADKVGITAKDYILIYEGRINEFMENPPGADWDGVYTADSK